MDLCYTINYLAKLVTEWDKLCDKQLNHLFPFLQNTLNTKMAPIIDDRDIGSLEVHGYPDADLCGHISTIKSTTGVFLCVQGKHGTCTQLDWFSKRQTATAHSTSESELIALSKLLRECLVPQQGLWAVLLGRAVKVQVSEDKQAAIKMVEAGYYQQMRHLPKHHRISLGLTHEFFQHDDLLLNHIDTTNQKGDLFTKGLSPQKHNEVMR